MLERPRIRVANKDAELSDRLDLIHLKKPFEVPDPAMPAIRFATNTPLLER